MKVDPVQPPCVPPLPVQPPPELPVPQEKEEAVKDAVVQEDPRSVCTARSLPPRSRSPPAPELKTAHSREPSTTTARSKSRSRSRSPKVKSSAQTPRGPLTESVTARSASLPPEQDSVKKLYPGKLALKENPRSVCEERYSPTVDNVIIYRQHHICKDFWDRYPVEKHPVLGQHTDKTKGRALVWSCSKCNAFLPRKDLMMWQACERRWPCHSATCHPECDFYVSPTGLMYMKNPANNSKWWPLSAGKPHYDQLIHVIKELSKSLPPFCLPDVDGNIFSVTEHNLISCMRCGFSYPRQIKYGNCGGWEKQIQEHYKEAHPYVNLPSMEEIVSMWNDTIIFQKRRTPIPS